jgi:methionyl-tRNA formyltransferase
MCCIHAVFCNPDRPRGRGHSIDASPVKVAAQSLGLDVQQPESWKSDAVKSLWESLNIDLALVVAYGHILPPWMIDRCKLGVWNLHFSLLPRWRGAAPANHAILAGDDVTGVSLMKVVPGLDAGPVLSQCKRHITMETVGGDLLTELAEDSAELLRANLGDILDGSANVVAQDEALVTLAPKLRKEMAKLDLTGDATDLHRRIRAFQPWPGAEFILDGTTIKVLGVGSISPSDHQPGTLHWDRGGAWLTAGGGSAIELLTLQRPGKSPQPAKLMMHHWGAKGCAKLPA